MLAVHRVADLRRHPQPVGPRPHAGRLERRLGAPRSPPGSSAPRWAPTARGSIRIPAGCCGLFGLKPQRGRVPLAPDAEHWHGLSVCGPLDAPRRRRRAVPRRRRRRRRAGSRRPPRRRRRARCGSRSRSRRPAADAIAVGPDARAARRASSTLAELLRALGHEVASATPTTATRSPTVLAALPARHRTTTPRRCRTRERLERRTRGDGAGIGAADLRRRCSRARARPRPRRARASNAIFDDHDVAADADAHAAPPSAIGELRGPRRAVDAQRRSRAGCPYYGAVRTTPASPPPRCRPASTRDGFPLAVAARRPPRRRGDAARRSPRSSRPTRPWADRRPRSRERRRATCSSVAERRSPREAGALLRERVRAAGAREVARQEHADRPRQRGRPRRRAADPRRCSRRAARTTASGGGGRRRAPARAACAGSSTRSTARSTSSSASRSGRSASPCEDDGGVLAGVVFDPMRDELFAARERGGAADARRRAARRPSRTRATLATALVATGFGYDAEVRAAQAEVVARLLPRVRDIRRFGCAALDLAWTAAGRYDAYYERGVKHWDFAAGRAALRARRARGARAAARGAAARPGSSSRRRRSPTSWPRSSADDGARPAAQRHDRRLARLDRDRERPRRLPEPVAQRGRVAGDLEARDAARVAPTPAGRCRRGRAPEEGNVGVASASATPARLAFRPSRSMVESSRPRRAACAAASSTTTAHPIHPSGAAAIAAPKGGRRPRRRRRRRSARRSRRRARSRGCGCPGRRGGRRPSRAARARARSAPPPRRGRPSSTDTWSILMRPPPRPARAAPSDERSGSRARYSWSTCRTAEVLAGG